VIRYSIVHPEHIKTGILNGFRRYTETVRVKYVENGVLLEKDDCFVDEWDTRKLSFIESYMKNEKNITILAKDNKNVVGFAVLDTLKFDGYMNVVYIHTDNRYRGQGIGTNLLLLASKTAKDLKAEKLYISGHPAVEAQAFYKKMGCVLAQKINKELYEIEPLDIQLERSLDYNDIVMRKIDLEFQQYNRISSTILNKLLPRIYSVMPQDDADYIYAVSPLIISDSRPHFSMGTLLLKKRTSVVDEKYLSIYENLLLNHIHDWDQVDQYCYRVLGPIFNANYSLYSVLKKWSKSKNKDVRRAALVSMLISSQKITCTYPIEHVLELVGYLKDDEDYHVKKAVGWVLKCAYVTYPQQIIAFLTDHYKTLDRMIFRYACEHMDTKTRNDLLHL
jgi:ribosomal protein S18 acetylase RimI-like enzyme/3-methyladenine DNA glycosylase AlkC